MNNDLMISGFSDEISSYFDTQLTVVSKLGMKYISLRGIDGKNIAEYTVDEIKENVLPRLQKSSIRVSSIGSPIGKVFINDEDGFIKQKATLERICQIANLLECKYMRVFSFYIPKGEDPDNYRDEVIYKLKEFANIAERFNVVLLHEKMKRISMDIFQDVVMKF